MATKVAFSKLREEFVDHKWTIGFTSLSQCAQSLGLTKCDSHRQSGVFHARKVGRDGLRHRLFDPCKQLQPTRFEDRRRLHTNRLGLPPPSRSSAAQRSRAGPAPAPLCAAPHTAAPCARQPCILVPLVECAPISASPCGAACAEPCDRFPESRRWTPL